MSMPMKTRLRATILPLAACGALALMGACSDATAPQPAAAPSQTRAGFVPARTDFGGYLGTGKAVSDSVDAAVAIISAPKTSTKRLPAP